LFATIIERHVRGWIERSEVRLLSSTREMVLALILRMLGVPEQDLETWRKDYEDLMLLALNVPLNLPGTPNYRGLAARARLDARLSVLVCDVRGRPDARGLLAEIARGRDESGRGLEERELLDNLRLLILAGHETTASTMAWMVATLAQRSDVWEALRREVIDAADVPRAPPDLKRFPYAEALFREVLRLYPPVNHDARRLQGEITVAGRVLPSGTVVSLSLQHLSRHPSLYERPDELLPERWLQRSGAPSPIELAQFGGGPHFCLGYHMAWMESVQFAVILARELAARGVRPALAGRPPVPRHMPLLRPDAGARVHFKARSTNPISST
jgi:cytochrome P450